MSITTDTWKAADYFHKKYNRSVAGDNGGAFKVESIKGKRTFHLILWNYVMGRASHRFKRTSSECTYETMTKFIDECMKGKVKNYE